MNRIKGTTLIKIGTESLITSNGAPNFNIFSRVARGSAEIQEYGHKSLIVSSGAVGFGKALVPESAMEGKSTLAKKQVWASHGQHILIKQWEAAFNEVGFLAAQVLWTSNNLIKRSRRRDAQNFIDAELMLDNSRAVINANDTATTEELKNSDNDRLTGLIIRKIILPKPITLIFVTDVPGVFNKDPKINPDARLIPHIPYEDRHSFCIDTRCGSKKGGSGGMKSKITVGFLLAKFGVTTHIVSVDEPDFISRIMIDREPVGTTIHPRKPSNFKFYEDIRIAIQSFPIFN
ncbi:MAG: hypothetical protein P4M13_08360 [Alphaproteobacteria bacterium]|nr:hypothetical protein [Alphaproteobacteria bacterium]